MNTKEVIQSRDQVGIVPMNSFFAGEMPDLSKAKAAPLELNSEYWTPEKSGEMRRMFFKELCTETTTDMASGKDVDILVAYFVEVVNGNKRVIRQASRRLTAVLELRAKEIVEGTPLEITYLGKMKNKTNAFQSDTWSIKPLYI